MKAQSTKTKKQSLADSIVCEPTVTGWRSRPELAIRDCKEQERRKTAYLLRLAGF